MGTQLLQTDATVGDRMKRGMKVVICNRITILEGKTGTLLDDQEELEFQYSTLAFANREFPLKDKDMVQKLGARPPFMPP